LKFSDIFHGMRSLSAAVLGASTLCVCLSIACAVGVNDSDPPVYGTDEDAAPPPAKRDSGTPKPDAGNPLTMNDAGRPQTDGGTTSDASATPDAGVDAGGGPLNCAATSTCATANSTGSVSGDSASTPVVVTGDTSAWVLIRVTEDDSGAFGVKLRLRATLASPVGANFDLYMYEDAPTQCTTATKQSVMTSGSDIINTSFGESGFFSNASNDDKDIYLEVRHVSGVCKAGTNWTLTFEGNK
jgi:hypothetical protein